LSFASIVNGGDRNGALLIVVLHGLNICVTLHINNIVLEVNSYFDLSFISLEDSTCSHFLLYIRRSIREFLVSLNYSISTILEEGNAYAQAKLDSNYSNIIEFSLHQLPIPFEGLIRLDQSGLPYVNG